MAGNAKFVRELKLNDELCRHNFEVFFERTNIRLSHWFGRLKQTCCWSTSVKEALLSQKKMGHLHDDISVLATTSRILQGFAFLCKLGLLLCISQFQLPTPPICPPCQSRGGAFANFVLPGGRAFANPRAKPKLLTRTQFPIRI